MSERNHEATGRCVVAAFASILTEISLRLRECPEIIKDSVHRTYCVDVVWDAYQFSESGPGIEETGRYGLARKYLCNVLNVFSKQ